MRKTIVLAAATEILAVAAVVASLIRADAGTSSRQVSPAPVTQVQTTATQAVKIFDAI
jgi:hypothetical protein